MRIVHPSEGETRIITKWLLFPLTLRVESTGKTETRWLCKATILQRYNYHYDGLIAWSSWDNMMFIDFDKEEKSF